MGSNIEKQRKKGRVGIRELTSAAKRVLDLAAHYSTRDREHELWYDGILLGYLEGMYGKMKRQHSVKAGRVDFRQGGENPIVMELAVGTRGNRGKLCGSQNRGEIKKLAKYKEASGRFLLLLDPSREEPLSRTRLEKTYAEVELGPGNFLRKTVRVIYVHREVCYDFLKKP